MGVQTASLMRSFKVAEFGKPLCEALDPVPVPKGREVLVRVSCCGVCHSDLHLWEGHFDLGGGQQMDLSRTLALPRTLGHEIAGVVEAVGSEADDVAPGERVLLFPWIGCGKCNLCHAGNEHLCVKPAVLGTTNDGGYSDHVLLPDSRYALKLGDLPEASACTYACSGLTAYSALKKAVAASSGDAVMIIGAGGVGLAAIRLAKAVFGISPIVVEIDRSKWESAQAAGAAEVVDLAEADVRRRLMRQTGGGVGAAIDFVGSQATAEFGTAVLRKGGLMILVGLFGGSMQLQLPLMPLRSVGIVGSYVGSLRELHELLDIARDGHLDNLPITERPLGEAQAAIEALKAGRVIGRMVLRV